MRAFTSKQPVKHTIVDTYIGHTYLHSSIRSFIHIDTYIQTLLCMRIHRYIRIPLHIPRYSSSIHDALGRNLPFYACTQLMSRG